jgi:hypothetical protein
MQSIVAIMDASFLIATVVKIVFFTFMVILPMVA